MGYRYLYQVLIAVDQLFNTLAGGWADETLSSRCYRNKDKYRLAWVIFHIINGLFFDRDHCLNSFISEIQRRQLPAGLRPKKSEKDGNK